VVGYNLGFVLLHLAKDVLLSQTALHYKLGLLHTSPFEGIPLLAMQWDTGLPNCGLTRVLNFMRVGLPQRHLLYLHF